MSRINSNVASMIAQRVSAQNDRNLSSTLERLSTGFRINRGSDSPAGLIISENLRGDIRGINAAIGNAQRAEQVVNIAEGGLQEISNALVELQGLVGQTANKAGISAEERDANQQQIDSILSNIDRLSNSVSFQGSKLLNGNFDYVLSGGSANSGFTDVTINGAKLPDGTGGRNVTVIVTQSAQTARQSLVMNASLGANFTNSGNGAVTFEITGTRGSQQFTFASGTANTAIRDAINSFKDALGVSAALSGTAVGIRSTGYGSDAFVRVREVSNTNASSSFIRNGTGGASVDDLRTTGRDLRATINGISTVARGLNARISMDGLEVSVTIAATNALNNTSQSRTFNIRSGGADFNLGAEVNIANRVSLGIKSVSTGSLGDAVTGYLSALRSGGTANVQNGNLTTAQDILDNATRQVASLRGRLGAFTRNVVGSTVNALGVALENTTAAESAIRDTDFAAETAAMTRNQILKQASTQALQMANSAPQSVLQLMR